LLIHAQARKDAFACRFVRFGLALLPQHAVCKPEVDCYDGAIPVFTKGGFTMRKRGFIGLRGIGIRMPLMPEINDSEKNLFAMAELLGEFGVHDIDVLPSHAFGRNKYAALQLPFPQTRAYAPEELEATLERFRNVGITPHIVK
jgi:hypothetical protein